MRRGENIYKRRDGRWEGRYIYSRDEKGKAIYPSVYGHSYVETKEKLKISAILRLLSRGTHFRVSLIIGLTYDFITVCVFTEISSQSPQGRKRAYNKNALQLLVTEHNSYCCSSSKIFG